KIQRGELVAIVGASGAGKSTLLHIIGTLDKPSSGTVTFDEHDLFRMTDTQQAEFRNRRIGFVFQFHHLLAEFTALENACMPALVQRREPAAVRADATTLLTEVGLGHRLQHKPGELSGGEQQRVAMARALVMHPRLLLADEPTGNLDPETGEGIHKLLRDLNQRLGITCLVVTHNAELARNMRRQLRLREGRLEETRS